MQIKKISEAILPTIWGDFTMIGFEEKSNGKNHIALIYGDFINNTSILTRIHSECLTGDALFSLRCDCGFQLKTSLEMISSIGTGILIYHRQEGRNIGLINKIKAYNLQDKGLDTVEANHKLGFKTDERDFTICSDILEILNVKKVRLLTNNPKKLNSLKKSGINIIERVPLIVGRNNKNSKYLDTKENKMGHILS
ncbi:GTP cyclohydrolase-2 [Buchnera aphidicola (Neophyllaphis podocarpi)]|uniref:GTP cyclohydrolase II n=1 Tax=Buchnera aphidicola TaxID=9 RepID=UPI0031B85233